MKDTEQNNKLLAEFLKLEQPKDKCFDHVYKSPIDNEFTGILLFGSDWNWLMQVVEKIESLNYNVEISKEHCVIIKEIENEQSKRISKFSNSKIEAVYNACIEFIIWYNSAQIKN